MKRTAVSAMAAAILCAAVSGVGAQEAVLRPGDKVRFHTDARQAFYFGELGRLTSDSLIMERCESCVSLSYGRSYVHDLAVFRISNRGDRFLTGLFIGGLVGGGLGAISANSCKGTADVCELSGLAIPFGAIAGALVGSAIGFMTGYRWVPIT